MSPLHKNKTYEVSILFNISRSSKATSCPGEQRKRTAYFSPLATLGNVYQFPASLGLQNELLSLSIVGLSQRIWILDSPPNRTVPIEILKYPRRITDEYTLRERPNEDTKGLELGAVE